MAKPLYAELPHRLLVAVSGADASDSRWFARTMDPYPVVEEQLYAPSVRLTFDAQRPAWREWQLTAQDGLRTVSDGNRLYRVSGSTWCSIPQDPFSPTIFCHPEFPRGTLRREVLSPALQVALVGHGAVPIHATSVMRGSQGIAVAGWSESGKTETALALMEKGFAFVTDKWSILTSSRTIRPFPASVGVRRWVVPKLPRLRSALPPSIRAQLFVAGIASSTIGALPVGRGPTVVVETGRVLRRATEILDRAAVQPSWLRSVYGGSAGDGEPALKALFFLVTVDRGVSVQTASVDRIINRLVRTGSYERRRFYDLDDRAGFALLRSEPLRQLVEHEERRLLRIALDGVALYEVSAPFPADPRQVVSAISRML